MGWDVRVHPALVRRCRDVEERIGSNIPATGCRRTKVWGAKVLKPSRRGRCEWLVTHSCTREFGRGSADSTHQAPCGCVRSLSLLSYRSVCRPDAQGFDLPSLLALREVDVDRFAFLGSKPKHGLRRRLSHAICALTSPGNVGEPDAPHFVVVRTSSVVSMEKLLSFVRGNLITDWVGESNVRRNINCIARPSLYLYFLKRTPTPPPFSVMNSIPAVSRAFWISFRLAAVAFGGPSSASARLTVERPTLAAFESSSALQRTSALAARI